MSSWSRCASLMRGGEAQKRCGGGSESGGAPAGDEGDDTAATNWKRVGFQELEARLRREMERRAVDSRATGSAWSYGASSSDLGERTASMGKETMSCRASRGRSSGEERVERGGDR